MREAIRMFVRDLDLIRTIEKNRGVNISDLARIMAIPYSTAYVKVHRLEKVGLLSLEYISGKKTVNLTKMAEELIEALEIIERSENVTLSSAQQPSDNIPFGTSQEHHQ